MNNLLKLAATLDGLAVEDITLEKEQWKGVDFYPHLKDKVERIHGDVSFVLKKDVEDKGELVEVEVKRNAMLDPKKSYRCHMVKNIPGKFV